VFPIVMANIDSDADGVISKAEERGYAERVLRDLTLTVEGDPLRLRLVSMKFPEIPEMKEGRGEIQIEFFADVPWNGPSRRLIFENRHQGVIAAYLVNCLVPRDPHIRVAGQNRNFQQSFYQLDYVQAGVGSSPLSFAWWSGTHGWLGMFALILFGRFAWLWRHRAGLATPAVRYRQWAGDRFAHDSAGAGIHEHLSPLLDLTSGAAVGRSQKPCPETGTLRLTGRPSV